MRMPTANNTSRALLLAAMLLIPLMGCTNQEGEGGSNVRFANFLLPGESVLVRYAGGESGEIRLDYGKATPYRQIREGRYTFKVFTGKGDFVDQKELGIGKGSRLTLTISGLGPAQPGKGKTLKTKLLQLFEGAEAQPANATMPIIEVFLDRFEGKEAKGKLKVVNMAAALPPIQLSVEKKGELHKVTTVPYPHESSRDYSLAEGDYPVSLGFQGSSVNLFSGTVHIRAAELTTLYIFGRKTASPYQLQVLALQSK